MPPLTNSAGQPTGAVYGVCNMLKRLMADEQPRYVAMVMDASGPTFRDEMYTEYKANRPPMPDELRVQREYVLKLVEALALPLLEVPGVEADDVIGTLARQGSAAGMQVVISSSDKDMAQLVDERTVLSNTMSGTVLDPDGVRDKFGVGPAHIIDYLALIGDTVDNVPGVPKVGPKTAAKWLEAHGSLDGVIENAASIKGKIGDNLRDALEQLPLSRELVTIKCDVELGARPDELSPGEPDRDALKALYSELEFKTWLADMIEGRPALGTGGAGAAPATTDEDARSETAAPTLDGDYETVLEPDRLDAWVQALSKAELVAFDTETTSLDYMRAELVGVSFATEAGKAAYVPVAHDYPDAPEQLARDVVLERLKPVLEDASVPKVGQNLKYDMSVLARYGISLRGVRFDTMLESYVLDSTATRHDMDSLSLKYLKHKTIKFEEVAGKGAKQLTFNQVALEQAAPYAAEDADITLRLHAELWPRLVAEPTLEALYDDIELPLLSVLSRIERTGVRVDADLLKVQSTELAKRMQEVENEAYEAAGHPFNLGSPKQIQQVLFEEQGLPVLAKTPKGAPSTAESALGDLAHEYDLPRLILEHRGLNKLRSTYTEALPEAINPDTGRVHTSYHQAVASTGRLSSTEPNLQNIPIRTPEGRRVRQAFVPDPGNVLMAADYSQIELRIMAHLSADDGLLAAFKAGADVHRATASEVFGSPLEEVSDDDRRRAKAINFGLIYGMSAFGLAKQIGTDRAEAQGYMDLYFARYPGVARFMEETRVSAREKGYVETVFGRRLYLPEINARNAQRRQYAERTAINAPMQGTAADIIKRAMLRIDAWLTADDAGAATDVRLIMQVHDELVFEVPAGRVEQVAQAVSEMMAASADLTVPLEVSVGVGQNWDEAH